MGMVPILMPILPGTKIQALFWRTVDTMAQALYPGRYIVQRNNVSAIIPLEQEQDGSTAWILLANAAQAGIPSAGQALGVCWDNDTYRMNGGSNCDHDNPECVYPCEGACALDYGTILQRSADHIATYSANYYEIYPPDASNLDEIVTRIHCLLNPDCERGRNEVGAKPIHLSQSLSF